MTSHSTAAESGAEAEESSKLADRDENGMRAVHGVVELQLEGLKLDNLDVLDPLSIQLQALLSFFSFAFERNEALQFLSSLKARVC